MAAPDGAGRSLPAEFAILEAVAGIVTPIVLIDGFSGAGKSTLADRLVEAWSRRRRIRPQLLRLEWVYPGWGGLEAASTALRGDVLEPIGRARAGNWRRWDWATGAPAESHPIDPTLPLIVEGSGALTRANRDRASVGVWVELDAVERERRAIARDGDTYRPHWEGWARQERNLAARERPTELADLQIDGRTFTTMGQ